MSYANTRSTTSYAPMSAPTTRYVRSDSGDTAGRPMAPPPVRMVRADSDTAGRAMAPPVSLPWTSKTRSPELPWLSKSTASAPWGSKNSMTMTGGGTTALPRRSKNDMTLAGVPLTTAQVNARMGWTPSRLKLYWDERAQRCEEMGDEGSCLARVARHVPVTIGNYEPDYSGDYGLGTDPSPADVANVVAVAGRLISAPDATLRAQGPAIVAAVDRHLLAPVMNVAVQRAMPYVVRYMGPPLVVLYLLSGMATYFSFEVLAAQKKGLLKNSRRRKRRRSRRN